MVHRQHLGLVAAAALLVTGQAMAAATSTATISNLQVQVIDLNPNDGITAAVTFNYDPYDYCGLYGGVYCAGSYVSVYAYQSAPADGASGEAYGTGVFGDAAIARSTSLAAASGSVVHGAGGVTISATGSAQGANSVNLYDYAQYSASAQAPYYYYWGQSFTLTDNTLLLVTAVGNVSTQTTIGYDPVVGYGYESASASLSLGLWGPAAGGNGSQSSSSSLGSSVSYTAEYDPQTGTYHYHGLSDSQSANLAASFVNVSGGELIGTFQASTSVSGISYAQAVPEPSSYAMMAAGLAVMGSLVRRRSRRG